MKRMSLLLGIVAFAAISAPLAAQGNGGKYGRAGSGVYGGNRGQVNQGCSWWDVNCTNTNGRARVGTNRSNNDSGWYRIGTDRSGNVIYERDTYDRNGRETIELARQDRNGRLKVIDRQKVDNRNNGSIYNNNGVYNNGRIYDNRGRGQRRGDGNQDDR
jgi:hypothetical protein